MALTTTERRAPATTWAWAAAGTAVVLPVASVPSVDLPTWALRWALLPAIAGIGLPAVVALARTGRTARWVLAWLAWCTIATLAAPRPWIAFWGQYRVGTGLMLFAAAAGAWGLGVRGGEKGASLVARSLLAGCTINAGLAVLSQLCDLRAFGFAPLDGRSTGTYGNPVFLAELLCGGLWLALRRVEDGPGWVLGAGVLITAGVELSGSRAALVLAVAAGLVAAGRRRGRARWLTAGVVAAGIALGAFVAAVSPGALTSTDRVTGVAVADSGIRPRVDTWRTGLEATASRPLWGYGPAGVLGAVGPRRTLGIARGEAPDTMFADVHNVVVEALVTTGVVGAALLLLWAAGAVGAARRRRGAEGLLGFAALVAGVCLLEPLHPGVLPLVTLALGAAGTTPAATWAIGRVGRAATAVIALAGVAASLWLAAALVALHRADIAGDPAAAAAASRRLPPWAEGDAVVGRLVAFTAITTRNQATMASAIGWWTRAAAREPDDPSRWDDLGGAQEQAGDRAAAAVSYRRALVDNPWSARALTGLERVGTASEQATARRRLALLR